MTDKIIRILANLFAWGMAVLMLVAFVVAVGYIIAFFIGASAAEVLCGFFGTYLLHPLYIIAMALCVIGVVNMYLRHEHVFLLDLPMKGKKK